MTPGPGWYEPPDYPECIACGGGIDPEEEVCENCGYGTPPTEPDPDTLYDELREEGRL